MIVIVEGPDNSGKTTLARALSARINVPYYKYPKRPFSDIQAFDTKLVTRYVDRWLVDFLAHVPQSLILDRSYPTEWVYGEVFQREIDLDDLVYVDQGFALLDAHIVLCTKQSYVSYTDDLIASEALPALVEQYHQFQTWTRVQRILALDTTNENLEEQLEAICAFIKEYA